jgi:hypothetical protein
MTMIQGLRVGLVGLLMLGGVTLGCRLSGNEPTVKAPVEQAQGGICKLGQSC